MLLGYRHWDPYILALASAGNNAIEKYRPSCTYNQGNSGDASSPC